MRKNAIDSRYDLAKWTRGEQRGSKRVFNVRQQERRGCVYCEDGSHKSVDCPTVCDPEARRKVLLDQKLCFNCTKPNCRVGICKSFARCRRCNAKHHTSLHAENTPPSDSKETPTEGGKRKAMTANGPGEGLLPILVIELNRVRCRALVDSGAGSSYTSRTILNMIGIKPFKTEYKAIEMMLTSKRVRLDKYKAKVESIDGTFELPLELTRVDKTTLLDIENPYYQELQTKYSHLQGIELNDNDEKSISPVHVILGSGDYARIKTKAQPLIGNEGEPIAEKTRLG